MRGMSKLRSRRSTTRSGSIGLLKLGQPVPESYFSRELNRGWPVATSMYRPSA